MRCEGAANACEGEEIDCAKGRKDCEGKESDKAAVETGCESGAKTGDFAAKRCEQRRIRRRSDAIMLR